MYDYNNENKNKKVKSFSNEQRAWNNTPGWTWKLFAPNAYKWKTLYKRIYKEAPAMGFEALQGANEVQAGYPIKGDFYEEVDLNELLAIRQIDTIGDPEILKYVKVWLKNLNKFRFGPLRTILVLLLWAAMFIMLNFRETKEYALCFLLPVSILFTCFWLFRFIQTCLRKNAYNKVLKRWKVLKNR